MSILENFDIDGDDYSVGYKPFMAKSIGNPINIWDMDDYGSYVFQVSSTPVCVPKTYFGLKDSSTEITTKENICTLAIRLKEFTESINNIVWFTDESIWGEDYSDENPLEIKLETENINYDKDDLFKDVFRVYQECLEQNWDGYDAEPMNKSAFFELSRFIDIMPIDIPAPEVIPDPEGGIALEWYKDLKNIFVISFSGIGIISYAGLFGAKNKTHGTESFVDSIPNIIEDYIRRIKI